MEIWDAYYPNGTLAGCNLVRGKPIPNGFHQIGQSIISFFPAMAEPWRILQNLP